MSEDPVPITNRHEVLRRQIHPAQLEEGDAGRVLSVAFKPRWDSDEPTGDMSHLRGSVEARDAYRRYTALGRVSAGTWGVNVGQVLDLELEVADDSALPTRPKDHAFVRIEPKRQGWRRIAKDLASIATKCGCLFAADVAKPDGKAT